ncbi:uncharacterized protein TNCV_2796481 [Trichonephila clavipes]|nr:uncharacterized protein TNCV_2796481 [Trichonephila clavipes]
MSLNKLRKDELKIVAEELNLIVPEGAKIADLKSLIVNSDVYKKDKELVQSAIDYALAEIKNKRLDSETKLEFERIKLAQLQKQLELANIQKNLLQNSDIRNPNVLENAANINVETLLKSVKTLTIPVPSRVESYNLFFQSLEKAFKIKEVPEQFKGEILLNILGERVNNLLVHVSEEELNNYKWQTFRALLDSESESCIISNECANKLRLKTERINTLISCLNGASMVVNWWVKVAISNQNKSFERELDMLVVKKITDFIPQKALEINSDFSNFVELADSNFNVPGKIDLLLGANIFYELLKPERIKIKDSQLLLVNSVFGYIVTGNLDSINETKVHCGLIRNEDLNKTLEKFWKVEEVEEPIVKNKERLMCEEHYANTQFRTKEGKYVVSMPLKKEPSCLGNSKDIALKRFGSLWNRLARDKNYSNLYREFLRDYERLGHMKEVTNETEPEITYYATHHGIYRPEKSTTKLRVVFNCSSLTDNGISLNDIQYNGGVIQEDLYAQMLRFRTYTYAFTADIKMMYRTILINPKERNLQRIVWCESEHESPKIYELSTVTYGSVSAPYLAQRTLTQLSMDEEATFPIAASVLRNNLYMNDVLCGAATLEEAIVLRQELKGILKSAGMELHKLCANHEKLSPDPEQNYNFATLTETKTLGVSWKPNLDCFLIKVKVCLDSSYTKRDVLSTIAKIFDPVGLMAPVISKEKIFLQRLWRSKLEWNDLLPAEEYREWHQFLVSLENINNIEIPRRILVAFPEVIEIHGFADASERCYGAAV